MAGLKTVTYIKISPKMVKPRDLAGTAEDEEEEVEKRRKKVNPRDLAGNAEEGEEDGSQACAPHDMRRVITHCIHTLFLLQYICHFFSGGRLYRASL